jgi:hypothetical protein
MAYLKYSSMKRFILRGGVPHGTKKEIAILEL